MIVSLSLSLSQCHPRHLQVFIKIARGLIACVSRTQVRLLDAAAEPETSPRHSAIFSNNRNDGFWRPPRVPPTIEGVPPVPAASVCLPAKRSCRSLHSRPVAEASSGAGCGRRCFFVRRLSIGPLMIAHGSKNIMQCDERTGAFFLVCVAGASKAKTSFYRDSRFERRIAADAPSIACLPRVRSNCPIG